MAKYVKCVQADACGILTEGYCYKIVNSDSLGYLVSDNQGELAWVRKYRFEEPYELQEPITFASQEDFENAVMAVIMKRLCIHSHEAYIQVGDFGSSC